MAIKVNQNPPRQPYVPPFKQQPQWQPNQQQGWKRNNDDDPYGTILKALGDLKEGHNRIETKFEDLSSRVKRLEAKEEQSQARQGRIPSQPEPAKAVTVLQRGNPSEINYITHAFVGAISVLQDYKATKMDEKDKE